MGVRVLAQTSAWAVRRAGGVCRWRGFSLGWAGSEGAGTMAMVSSLRWLCGLSFCLMAATIPGPSVLPRPPLDDEPSFQTCNKIDLSCTFFLESVCGKEASSPRQSAPHQGYLGETSTSSLEVCRQSRDSVSQLHISQ